MKKINKNIIIIISTLILIILMIMFIDLEQIITNLIKISFLGSIGFFIIYFIVFLLRALRLKLIFKSLEKEVNYSIILASYGIGWSLNELTPAKVGDLARVEAINIKNQNIGRSKSLCGISIERVIDLMVLFFISGISLLILYFSNVHGAIIGDLQFFLILGFLFILAILIILAILFIKSEWILNPVEKISSKLYNLLSHFLDSFFEGLTDFKRNRKEAMYSLILSGPIWLIETFTLILIFYLTGNYISFFIIILAQIIVFFSKFFPITPGGWVISENIGSLFIIAFVSINYDAALSLFVLDHMLRNAFVFIYGIISGISINFFKNVGIKKTVNMEKKNLN